MFIVVLVAILALLGAAHWYLWKRLVRDVSAPGSRYRRTGNVLAVLLPAVMLAAQFGEAVPFTVQQVLGWPGFMWFAVLIYLLMALLVLEPVRPLLRRFLERRDARRASRGGSVADAPAVERRPGPVRDAVAATVPTGSTGGAGPAGTPAASAAGTAGTAEEGATAEAGGDGPTATGVPRADGPGSPGAGADTAAAGAGPSRRLFVARAAAVTAGTVAAGTVGYGTWGMLGRGPKLKRVRVPLAKLPRGGQGYRIAVVSDIHLGPLLGRAHSRRIVDMINSTGSDMIAVVGDLVDSSVENLESAAEPLADLSARDGSYFVTGNHEYFAGAEEWVDHVRELGLRPLENEREELRWFDLAGVNDVAGEDYGDGPDFEAALGDRDPSRASVLLAHQPVQIHEAVDRGVGLQLSGHTHGGQMWPGNLLADLANPTLAGLERYGDTQLYVSRGAGAWGPPVRVGAEADITVVELVSAQA